MKIVLKHECLRKDLQALLNRTDFETTECDGSRKVKNGYTLRQFGCRTELYRKTDGCRIRICQGGIEVEVSVPRVLGFLNDEQDKLSEDDVLRVIRMVTVDLFPLTTWRARVPKPGCPRRYWHITRLDIAINFSGRILEFVETYRFASRPRSSTKPVVYAETGMAFTGKDYDLAIYDPSQRQPRKLREPLAEKQFLDVPNRVRVELRFKNPRAIKKLLRHFALDCRGLPFLAPKSDGSEAVYSFGLDHHRLHQVIATELRSLGRGLRTRSTEAKSMNLLRQLGFRYLAEHPEAWSEIRTVYGPRGYRRLKQEFTALEMRERDIDIVRSAWKVPREHPSIKKQRLESLQRSVLAQRRRSPRLIENC